MNRATIPRFHPGRRVLLAVIMTLLSVDCGAAPTLKLARLPQGKPRSIVIILTDDHRYDAMGFMGHPFLETPNLDRLAKEGVHCRNAFVTTSLCSPSRASILTGLYAHRHGVVDNYNPVRPDLVFFPQYLQKAGYQTAFIGKWHMGGDTDEPQRGFDYWLSFKGQGTYWADGRGTSRVVPQTTSEGYNLNGKRVSQSGYITDELTDYAVEWLKARPAEKPYLLYLSHKAVHSDFVAADRHRGRYADKPFQPPLNLNDRSEDIDRVPMWRKNQRNSRHGVEYGYNLPSFDLAEYYRRYCETLLAVDENVGRVIRCLEERGELDSTLILYLGDNGFQFGEHGLIDKRTAYEASMRIPMLLRCPELFKAGTVVTQMVANIDVAPTLLEAAGLKAPKSLNGRSFLPLARGLSVGWRESLLYEYYWEWNYPQTPTVHALRTDRYKYIRYHGVWDLNELYDLQSDPEERSNLIFESSQQERIRQLNQQLFETLGASDGQSMPLLQDRGEAYPWRKTSASPASGFPSRFIRP